MKVEPFSLWPHNEETWNSFDSIAIGKSEAEGVGLGVGTLCLVDFEISQIRQ